MPFLFISHIFHYFWDKLNHCLRISYFKNIVEVKLGLVLSEPLLPPEVHFVYNGLQFLFIEFGESWVFILRRLLADQTCWDLYLLDNLVDHHGLVLVVLGPVVDWHWLLLLLNLGHRVLVTAALALALLRAHGLVV